jgi:hypothetical protein
MDVSWGLQAEGLHYVSPGRRPGLVGTSIGEALKERNKSTAAMPG